MLPKIISFSGGQTSGYMLRREIDKIGHSEFLKQFTTIFCNTGKEHDKTLDFVHEVETRWEIPIVWLEYCRIPAIEIKSEWLPTNRKRANLLKAQDSKENAHWFKIVGFHNAKRSNQIGPFDELLEWANGLPNVRTRRCSVQMKIRTMHRFLNFNGIIDHSSFIGIRNDEAHRKIEILSNLEKGEHPEFPLIDSKVVLKQVNDFWDSHPFNLTIPNHMGNCDLCFLKARWKRVAAAKADPKAAQWWRDWETKKASQGVTGDGARFVAGKSYQAIINDAMQPGLFDDQEEQDIPCSCAVGGYRAKDDEE